MGVPEVRHFLYKSKATAQFTSPSLPPPYAGRPDLYEKWVLSWSSSSDCVFKKWDREVEGEGETEREKKKKKKKEILIDRLIDNVCVSEERYEQ